MTQATEFVSFTFGNVSTSGFVTPEELAQIESGAVVDVVIRQVTVIHGDIGEEVYFGDIACTFIGGEPTPFTPASIPEL